MPSKQKQDKAVRIPKGWLKLDMHAIVQKGDRFFNTHPYYGKIGWNESLSIGYRVWQNVTCATYIRRQPTRKNLLQRDRAAALRK